MAALLRHGARRIGGSALQPAQAAVAGERRRLVPRRMLGTGERAAEEITRDIKRKEQELADVIAEGRRSLMASTNWRSELELQQKKEKLYEVLSEMENSQNRRLLQHLAVHVYPRERNTQWHRLRASKWATNVVRVVANVSFALMAAVVLDDLIRKLKKLYLRN